MSEESSKYTEYIKAKKAYDKAKKDVKEMFAIVEKIVEALKKGRIREDINTPPMIVNVNERKVVFPIPFPAKELSALHLLDTNEWPDAKQVRDNLNMWIETYLNAHKLRRAIPVSEQHYVEPLDKILRLE
jgi:hypothetical protein